MNIDQFWSLIEASRQDLQDACDQTVVSQEADQPEKDASYRQAMALQNRLELLEPSEIAAFQQQLWQRLVESYRWDLWAVAHIIRGFCSDDGFEYFQVWLIAQGRAYYELALQQPDRAADRAESRRVESELMLYAAGNAYEAKTGEYLPTDGFNPPRHPAGQRWSEKELEQLYPELYQRFPKPLWLTRMS